MTKPMVIIEPAGMKNQDGGEIWHIRLGFETVSWQLVAHIQKRFYSIHAEPFSRTPKSSKQKKGSASRVFHPIPRVPKKFFIALSVEVFLSCLVLL